MIHTYLFIVCPEVRGSAPRLQMTLQLLHGVARSDPLGAPSHVRGLAQVAGPASFLAIDPHWELQHGRTPPLCDKKFHESRCILLSQFWKKTC